MENKEFLLKAIDECCCLIDLHLHLDGSLSIKSARELAKIENVPLPDSDSELEKMLAVSEDCRNLNEYLEKFDLPSRLMQSAESIQKGTYNLCCELAESGFIYAELRFAPQKHCKGGLSIEQVTEAAISGVKQSGFNARIILCCMRDGEDNSAQNIETVRTAKKYLGDVVCACDLAGAEGLFPNDRYKYVFDEALRLGVPFTIHSGEALGAESVKTAIEFGADRIGHGVRSIEDDDVVKMLCEKKIPIEVCPTSNINTCVYESVVDMPIRRLLEKGVIVTINSDNMTVSATDVRRELKLVCEAFDFTKEDIRKLLINSADAAFADDKTKSELIDKINKW